MVRLSISCIMVLWMPFVSNSGDLASLPDSHQKAFQLLLHNVTVLQSNPALIETVSFDDVKSRMIAAEEQKNNDAKIILLKTKLAALQHRHDDTSQRIQALNAALTLFGDVEVNAGDAHAVDAEVKAKPAVVSEKPKSHFDSPQKQKQALTKAASGNGGLFHHKIKPLFDNKCMFCHEGSRAKAGFDLSSHELMMKGGKTGKAVVPGDAEKSLLYQMVAGVTKPYMPFQLPKLTDEEVTAIRDWINAGAKIPRGDSPDLIAAGEKEITDADRQFWSYQPLQVTTPQTVDDARWNESVIDRFIYIKMKEKGLRPAERADPVALIRRVYYDMIGLPPSPDEVKAFLADDSPDAYKKVIDRLLDSPHYGERWGRHWLDVARYADSGGYEFDVERPNAYHYRDFVIKALNQDMPYDQFIRWQLAGDEYEPDNPLARMATGFCTNGPTISNQKAEINRYNELDDILSTTISTTLGLTIACARCHDHKYDAITQKDYYQMLSVFTSSKRDITMVGNQDEFEAYQKEKNAFDEKRDLLRDQIEQVLRPVRESIREQKMKELQLDEEQRWLLNQPRDKENQAQKELLEWVKKETEVSGKEIDRAISAINKLKVKQLREELREWEQDRPVDTTKALTLTDQKKEPVPSYFLTRGNPALKAGEIEPGFLQVLTKPGSTFTDWTIKTDKPKTTLRRSALAEWILDTGHGAGELAARVMVNRIWHYHFGSGIVSTPSDFGLQGERPSHPELLDWLANDFVQHDWKMKRLHKQILLSETYRQSTAYHAGNHKIDPANTYLWHRRPKRVEAEVLRDAMLYVSGNLNPKMYGEGIFPWMHPDAVATGSTKKWFSDAVDHKDTWRRSVYVNIRRSVLMPMFQVYDMPDTTASCASRMVTTIAPQALFLLNNQFSRDQSDSFAKRIMKDAGSDIDQRIVQAYWLSLSRSPKQSEMNDAIQFMAAQANRYMMLDQDFKIGFEPVLLKPQTGKQLYMDKAFVDYCQVLYNVNEFIYVN